MIKRGTLVLLEDINYRKVYESMKMLWVCEAYGCHKVSHVVRLRRLKPLRNMMRRVQNKAIDVDRIIGELSMAAEQPGQLQLSKGVYCSGRYKLNFVPV